MKINKFNMTYPESSHIFHPWRCSWPEWHWRCLPRDEYHWTQAQIQHPGKKRRKKKKGLSSDYGNNYVKAKNK